MLLEESPPLRTGRAEFLHRMIARPGGKKLRRCIQCGTCSSSCPASHAMDLSPRQMVASLNAGMPERVLESKAPWLCASCYLCTVRCPSGVPVTELVYALKREALGTGQNGRRGGAMAKAFVRNVDKLGRNSEVALLLRYYLSAGLHRSLPALPLALRLLRKGRLSLRSPRIKGHAGLTRMLAAARGTGAES